MFRKQEHRSHVVIEDGVPPLGRASMHGAIAEPSSADTRDVEECVDTAVSQDARLHGFGRFKLIA
jgi:hypothetical protein